MAEIVESQSKRPLEVYDLRRPTSAPSKLAIYVAASALTLIVLSLIELPVSELIAILGMLIGVPTLIWSVRHALRDPAWSLFALLTTAFLNGFPLLTQAERLVLHYGTVLIFCAPLLPRLWRSEALSVGCYKFFCIYFLWALVTVLYSLEPIFSMGRLVGAWLAFLTTVLCAWQIRDREDFARLVDRLFLACALLVVANLLSGALLPSHITHAMTGSADVLNEQSASQLAQDNPFPRFSGLLGHPNEIGALMLVTWGVSVALWPFAARVKRIAIALVCIGGIILGAMADSRSPFVALGVGLVVFSAWRYRLRALPIIGLGCALAAVLLFHFQGTEMKEYLSRGDISTLTGRTEVWQFVLEKVRQRPLLGYGYQVAGAIFRDPHFQVWWGDWDSGPQSSLHNGYLDHAIGVGVPATILWLVLMLYPWAIIFRAGQDPLQLKRVACLVVLPMLIHNISEASIGDFGYGGIGLVFGVLWAVAERQRQLLRVPNREIKPLFAGTQWLVGFPNRLR